MNEPIHSVHSVPALSPTVRRLRRRAATDPLTRRAIARVREAPPHERLLTLAGCTLSEFATRLVPEVSRSRLRAVIEQAEFRGRMTRAWAERLAQVVGASAEEVLALFGIEQPASRGRPRRPSPTAPVAPVAPVAPAAPTTPTRRSA